MYPFDFAVVNRVGFALAVFRTFEDARLFADAYFDIYNMRYFVVPCYFEDGCVCCGKVQK